MKNKLNFLLLFSISLNFLFGQDLIERSQQGIIPNSTGIQPNVIAQEVSTKIENAPITGDLFSFSSQDESLFTPYVSDAVIMDLNMEKLTNLRSNNLSALTLQLPVNLTNVLELDLIRVDIHAPDFRVTTSGGGVLANPFTGVYYRGIVKGDGQSLAAVSIINDEVRIVISDKDANYVLGKLNDSDTHVLYNENNLIQSNPFTCGVTDQSPFNRNKQLKTTRVTGESRSSMSSCIPVYVEADFQTYQDLGSDVAAVNEYVGALINESITVYQIEQIDLALSEVKVWTSSDPYSSLNSTSDILERFGELLQNNYNGRLAHWISTRNLGGGVAWLDVLCDEYFTFNADFDGDGMAELHHAGPYAVSAGLGTSITPFPTYSWEVAVFVHEMGHNLGSPHTQSCSWTGGAIDGCVQTEGACARPTPNCPAEKGTIMSYCHLLAGCGVVLTNGFGQQPGDLIRDKVNNASCALSCEPPTCDDGFQNGDETGVDCGGTNCAPCPCFESPLTLTITFDNFPEETSWQIKDNADNVIHQGGTYNSEPDGSTLTLNNLTLSDGDGYVFEFLDSFGDGICCGEGNGSFTLTDASNEVLVTGGDFGSLVSKTFCIGQNDGGASCVDDIVINTNVNNATEQADKTITTNGTVVVSGSVTFKAGESITLNPGFSTNTGATFLGTIEACVSTLNETDQEESSEKIVSEPLSNILTKDKQIEQELSLFPNPTNSNTQVHFELVSPTAVSLSLYDMNGKLLTTFMENPNEIEGSYYFNLATSNLRVGMYYVVLTTEQAITSKKLIIIK